MNTPLINRQNVRLLALKMAGQLRNGRFTRVSSEFLEAINARVAEAVAYRVQTAPSTGKTL